MLEHLRDPLAFLRRVRSWLRPDGVLVASLPNVRHHSVIRGLLAGNWTYEPAGLLDHTHLRFFTRREVEKLLFRAGFEVPRLAPVPGPGYAEWAAAGRPGEVTVGDLRVGPLEPAEAEEFYTYQWLAAARPRTTPARALTSIVILTHNELPLTRACLDSIRLLTDEPYELVLVDNGSTDGTPDYLRALAATDDRVTLVLNPDNRGFPAGCNQGIAVARGTHVLLLNNDTVVTTGWLTRLLRALHSAPRIGLVGPCSNRVSGQQCVPVTYYQWDARSRLVVAEPVAGRVTYGYDGTGRQVTKDTGGDATRFVWDFDKVLQEADGLSGATEHQYLSTEGQYGDLVSAYDGTGTNYYAFDAQGSTEALLDDTGSVTGRLGYRAYGLPTTATGTGATERYAWVGQQSYRRETELDLYLLGTSGNGDGTNRTPYDPTTAVFLSKDPIEERGGTTNFYLYCANDPINHTDPSGNRILADQEGCCSVINYQGYVLSPMYVLKRELYDAVASPDYWRNPDDYRLIGKDAARIKERVYNGVDPLLQQLPPRVWIELEKTNRGYGPALRDLISRFNGADDVRICASTFEGRDRYTFGELTARGGRLEWYDYYRIGLQWDTNFPKAPGIIRLNNAIDYVKNGARNAFDAVAKGATYFVEAGIAALLQALSTLSPEFKFLENPDHFFANISHFTTNLTSALPGIIADHTRFRDAFLGGLSDGINEFVTKFPDNVIKLASDWLVEKLNIQGADKPQAFPENLEPVNIIFFLLNWLGLSLDKFKAEAGGDWAEIEATVQELVGGQIAAVLTDVQKLKDLFTKVWGGEDSEDNPFSQSGKAKLFDDLFEQVKSVLITELIKKAVTELAPFLTGYGGLAKLVQFLIRVVLIGPTLFNQVTGLLKEFGKGITVASEGKRDEVKKVVNTALPMLAKAGLTLLSGIVGFDSVIGKLKKPAEKIQTKVANTRASLVRRLRLKKLNLDFDPEPYKSYDDTAHDVIYQPDQRDVLQQVRVASAVGVSALKALDKYKDFYSQIQAAPKKPKTAIPDLSASFRDAGEAISKLEKAAPPWQKLKELLKNKVETVKKTDQVAKDLQAAGYPMRTDSQPTKNLADNFKAGHIRPVLKKLAASFQTIEKALLAHATLANTEIELDAAKCPINPAELSRPLNGVRWYYAIKDLNRQPTVNGMVLMGDKYRHQTVITEFEAILDKKLSGGSDTRPNSPERIWAQAIVGKGDMAGHVFARSLGGNGQLADYFITQTAKPQPANSENIVPLAQAINLSLFKAPEDWLNASLLKPRPGKKPYTVCIRISFNYPAAGDMHPARPSTAEYNIWVLGIHFQYGPSANV